MWIRKKEYYELLGRAERYEAIAREALESNGKLLNDNRELLDEVATVHETNGRLLAELEETHNLSTQICRVNEELIERLRVLERERDAALTEKYAAIAERDAAIEQRDRYYDLLEEVGTINDLQ